MALILFTRLPLELRQCIWQFSMPGDEPEVCVPGPQSLPVRKGDAPGEPMVVNTAFPVLMHVCREWRDYTLHHIKARFRFSAAAGCSVPFRPFRPELDTMYWTAEVQQAIFAPMYGNVFDDWLPQVQHLALPASTVFSGLNITDCIISFAQKLQSVSVVFADSSDDNWVQTKFQEPARRCRLRPIEGDRARNMTVVLDTWGGGDPEDRVPLEEFFSVYREELDRSGTSSIEWAENYAGQAWSIELGSFAPLRCCSCTFLEWCEGEWVELCGQRRLPRENKRP